MWESFWNNLGTIWVWIWTDLYRSVQPRNAMLCAMFSSDVGMLRLLAEHKADVNMCVSGLGCSAAKWALEL